MGFFKDFPTVCMFLAFFLSSCFFAYFSAYAKIGVGIAFLVVLILCIVNVKKFLDRKLRLSLILSSSAIILACVVSYSSFNIYADGFEKYAGESDYVQLMIKESMSEQSYSATYEAEIKYSPRIKSGTLVILETSLANLERGSVLEGEVEYISLDGYLGSFDAKSYYNPKKVMLVCSDSSLEYKYKDDSFSLDIFVAEIRDKLSAMIKSHTSAEAGGITSAVLLGDKSGIYDSVKRDFRRLGISHLLVISGTHFSVIVTMAENYMKKLKLKRKVRSILNIGIILFFMAVTGMTPSVVRAGVMHILAQLSVLVSRKPHTLNSFAISGCIILLINPLAAADCGLQLSFAATYSCIMVKMFRMGMLRPLRLFLRKHIPYMKRLISFIISVAESVLMTSFVSISLLPIIWLYFGEISLLSLPANLVFVPLVTILIYLGGAYLVLYPIKLFVAPMAAVINMLCSFISWAAGLFSSIDLAVIPINYSFTVFFIVPLTILVIAVPIAEKGVRKKVLFGTATVFVLMTAAVGGVRLAERGEDYISYSAEKGNDGFVLRSDGKLLLCEISDASYSFIYELTDDMDDLHCTEIESVLLTHYHSKHLRMIGKLCDKEIVRNLILTKPINEKEESIFVSLISLARERGIGVSVYSAGTEIPFYGTTVVCYREYLSRSTHPITAVSIKGEGDKQVFLASSSFSEMKSVDVKEKAEMADALILGRHSPVYKKVFGLTLDEPKTVLVSEDSYSYADDTTREYFDEYADVGGDSLTYRLD